MHWSRLIVLEHVDPRRDIPHFTENRVLKRGRPLTTVTTVATVTTVIPYATVSRETAVAYQLIAVFGRFLSITLASLPLLDASPYLSNLVGGVVGRINHDYNQQKICGSAKTETGIL